jgi:molybdopterin synthase catalytic subunit
MLRVFSPVRCFDMRVIKGSGVHKKGELTLSDVLKRVKGDPDFHKAGAIGVFVGVMRGVTADGEPVKGLELEAYEEKADQVLEGIRRDLKTQQGIVDVQIHHLLGEFNVGEELVYVVVAGSHRQNVFPVLEEAVDRYKKEVPIFKKETALGEKGEKKSYWVSERKSPRE